MSNFRALPLLLSVCVLLSSCVDGGPTESGRVAPLDVRPSFQVDPDLFPADPVDRVRLAAVDASTGDPVGTSDVSVDPLATQWTLGLVIDLGGAQSRVVVVDVELFAGQVVQWSGRLGPITVRAGAPAPAQSVGLNRGPLSNLEVASLTITGAPAQLDVGATAVLVANPTLVPGSTVTPIVFWASTDPTVATVTGTGLAATVTGVAAGTIDIVASSGTAHAEVSIEVRAVAPPGFDVEWRGTTTDWNTATNWSTGQVPTATDDVYIPAAAADPTITSNVAVGALTVGVGVTLAVSNVDLTVSGDLDAAGEILGGRVLLTGNGTTVRGDVTATLVVSASASASDALAVDALEITGGIFEVAGQTVTVASQLTATASGALGMAGGGTLTTTDAFFDGTGPAGLLNAGTLRVRGGFTVGADPDAFVATGTHMVVLDGPQDQTVVFGSPSLTGQRFHHLTVDKPGTVLFESDVVVTGTLDVVQGSVQVDPYELAVGTSIADPQGGLSYGHLRLVGPVTALPAAISSSVDVDAAVVWPANGSVAGDVTVNTSLTVPAGRTLDVSGSIFLSSGSTLRVDGVLNAARCLDNGATIIGSGTHPCGAPSGSKVWVGGDPGGPTDWQNANNWSPPGVPGPSDDVVVPIDSSVLLTADASVASLLLDDYAYLDLGGFTLTVAGDLDADLASIFNGLTRLTGPGGVLLGSVDALEVGASRLLTGQLYVSGDLSVLDADLDVGGETLIVSGALDVVGANAHLIMTNSSAYVDVGGDALFDGGDHTSLLSAGTLSIQGALTVTNRSATGFAATGSHVVSFDGSVSQDVSFAVPGSSQQRMANVAVSSLSPTTFLTDATALGDFTVTGDWTVPAGVTVSISGELSLYAGATFVVDGTVTALGGCVNYGGQILGNGTHPCPPPPAVDRTWVGGDTSGSPTDWGNPANWSPASVPTGSLRVYVPFTQNQPVMGSDYAVGGLIVDSSATLDLGGFTLTVNGDVAADGFVVNGLVDIAGVGQQLYGYLDDVRLSGNRTLTNYLYVYGTLDVRAELDLSVQVLEIVGDVTVQTANGRIIMTDPSSYMYALANIVFDGASESGYLTDGTLIALGDFTVGQTSDILAFRSTGTAVYFYGDTDQVVSFAVPAQGTQAFRDLYVAKSSGSLVLDTNVFVEGLFYASGSTLARGAGLAKLRVNGAASITSTTFDGLPLELITSLGPLNFTLQNMTFTNMPTDETQLYVAMPGAGATPLTLDAPIFNTVPGPNGLYLSVVNTSGQGVQLVVNVQNPTPMTVQPGQTATSGAPVSLVWPYP